MTAEAGDEPTRVLAPFGRPLAREFGIPIRYVGIGESLDDLRVFDPEAFVDGLLPEALA